MRCPLKLFYYPFNTFDLVFPILVFAQFSNIRPSVEKVSPQIPYLIFLGFPSGGDPPFLLFHPLPDPHDELAFFYNTELWIFYMPLQLSIHVTIDFRPRVHPQDPEPVLISSQSATRPTQPAALLLVSRCP